MILDRVARLRALLALDERAVSARSAMEGGETRGGSPPLLLDGGAVSAQR
jgi:hypothetical protein